jgi:shikimate kinase
MACIFLIGFMASGKTTIGKALAARLDASFADTDSLVERREGAPIRKIFARRGESRFRRLETEVLRDLLDTCSGRHAVIATGGGLPCTDDNMSLMNSRGVTVYLQSSIDDIMARVERVGERPIFKRLGSREGLLELLKNREPVYLRARLVVENSNATPPDRTAERIARMLEEGFDIRTGSISP